MIFASPSLRRTPADRVAAQISVARALALNGSAGPARTVCGAVFLDHLPVLQRDDELLGAYVECLLLLEMTALLPRLVQAIYGVSLDVMPMTGRVDGRRWLLKFGTGVTLAMPLPRRAERLQTVARWSRIILEEATREFAGAAVSTETALEPAA
ncbi:MAG: hypothetical protein M3N26_08960 [Pseudomonadota bacterium]|nr:hypothetical protein [Pseudomonadota bacterium]